MKRLILVLLTLGLVLPGTASAKERYGQTICKEPGYECYRVKRGESWVRLFPDDEERDIVKRLNRMNTRIWPGLVIAVPKNLKDLTIWDISPFPRYIDAPGEKVIFVSQRKLAWGAYSPDGELVWWGPISPGKSYCADVGGSCATPKGNFYVIRRQGPECESSVFPKPYGGAPMPWCMHFFRGYALHGSPVVPGYRDSHGCVRLFVEDAKWLNQQFIDLPSGSENKRGTRVIVGPPA